MIFFSWQTNAKAKSQFIEHVLFKTIRFILDSQSRQLSTKTSNLFSSVIEYGAQSVKKLFIYQSKENLFIPEQMDVFFQELKPIFSNIKMIDVDIHGNLAAIIDVNVPLNDLLILPFLETLKLKTTITNVALIFLCAKTPNIKNVVFNFERMNEHGVYLVKHRVGHFLKTNRLSLVNIHIAILYFENFSTPTAKQDFSSQLEFPACETVFFKGTNTNISPLTSVISSVLRGQCVQNVTLGADSVKCLFNMKIIFSAKNIKLFNDSSSLIRHSLDLLTFVKIFPYWQKLWINGFSLFNYSALNNPDGLIRLKNIANLGPQEYNELFTLSKIVDILFEGL